MLNNNVGAEAPLPTQSLGGDRVKSWEIIYDVHSVFPKLSGP